VTWLAQFGREGPNPHIDLSTISGPVRPLFRGRRRRVIFERAEGSEAAAEALYRDRMRPVSKGVNVPGRGDDDSRLIEPVEGKVNAARTD